MVDFITYQNQPIRYKTEGLGNTLVLLHGFLESLDIWDSFSAQLSKHYRVVTIDLPGHGESGYWGKVHSMELMAECVNEVLDHLNVEKCVIAGHSMGGYVAIHFAEKHPEKVKGFGFFHSNADADTQVGKINRDRVIAILNRAHVTWVSQFIPDLFAESNKGKFIPEIQKLQQIAGGMSAPKIIAAQAGMRDRESKLAFLAETSLPVFYIIGKEDSKMDIPRVLEQALKPKHCEVLLLSGVGHMGFIEARETTIHFIHGFLSTIYNSKI
ncbi:MAG: alpha/beta hydrolase [Bacteroidota bacterium]|nr:alpha/beta hydrolase [Bacteroidota bacterium]